MISWATIQTAIHGWAVALSGYPASQVIWKHQNGTAPDGDYLTLTLGQLIPIGMDAVTDETNLAAPAGQEVTITVSGDREFSLTVEAYTPSTVGDSAARAILSKMLTRCSLPSMLDRLRAVDVSHFDRGQIEYLPEIKEIEFQGRGVWENRMYVRDSDSEKTTYIETVEITDTSTGNVIIVNS